jgi:SAICAR synthetase
MPKRSENCSIACAGRRMAIAFGRSPPRLHKPDAVTLAKTSESTPPRRITNLYSPDTCPRSALTGWPERRIIPLDRCGPPLLEFLRLYPQTLVCPRTDLNECRRILKDEIAERVRDLSLQIYEAGRDHAAQRGIIVADTKFEFGTVDGKLLLIDECLTPDSSRFWPKDQYAVGQSPPSFDKQFVRDYLETLDWDKTPPAPSLPREVVEKTSAKYREAFRRLTGAEIESRDVVAKSGCEPSAPLHMQ